jgi:hypothetical protein
MTDQPEPFHCSTSAASAPLWLCPTAMQLASLVHATRDRSPPVLGLGAIDQVDPSHRSMRTNPKSADPCENPTAKQLDALEHRTPSSSERTAPLTLGLGAIDQVDPFQCSTSVMSFVPEFVKPTASQLVALRHAMSWSSESVAPLGFGMLAMLQVLPFQCSTNVVRNDPEISVPAAKQFVGLTHATLARLTVAPVGSGGLD